MTDEIIRVPRTTALFINGLGSILRDELGYPKSIQECWTFEHTAQWEECPRKGECSTHGDTRLCERHGQYYCNCLLPCYYGYRFDIYVGEGFFYSQGQRVEVRCRISIVHPEIGIDSFDIELWLRDGLGPVQSHRFNMCDRSNIRRDAKKPLSPFPPNRFAFWKDHPGLKSKRKSPTSRRLERLLRQNARVLLVNTAR